MLTWCACYSVFRTGHVHILRWWIMSCILGQASYFYAYHYSFDVWWSINQISLGVVFWPTLASCYSRFDLPDSSKLKCHNYVYHCITWSSIIVLYSQIVLVILLHSAKVFSGMLSQIFIIFTHLQKKYLDPWYMTLESSDHTGLSIN